VGGPIVLLALITGVVLLAVRSTPRPHYPVLRAPDGTAGSPPQASGTAEASIHEGPSDAAPGAGVEAPTSYRPEGEGPT
jgi:hypothetical protein